MGNNNLSDSEKILVKVDHNNLIYIDPNSVIDNDGSPQPRNVKQENLIMFVNLEADIIPRSILKSENDRNTLVSIARGTLNFLRNQKGGDYDTNWTESFYSQQKNVNIPFGNTGLSTQIKINDDYYDETGQSFGIDSINISIKGANSIPQVNISFIDVRGKTLFESPENSAYKAFFHLPWPIFYLTLKGYYGKAIKYRLHLSKFSSKFNDSTGNFDITTTFVGSTFAYLNDISLNLIMNAPYMYYVENTTTKNTDTNETIVEISRTSKGYQILKSIYAEYERKGLVEKGFPIKTLRELIRNAENLDKTLEKTILNDKLNPIVFVGMNEFEKSIENFEKACIEWAKKYLLQTGELDNDNFRWYELNSQNKKSSENIIGLTGITLEKIVINNVDNINKNKLFAEEVKNLIKSQKTGNSNFSVENILSKPIKWSDKYYRQNSKNQQYEVKFDLLISEIREIKKTFDTEKDKLINYVEDEMNKIIINKDFEGGFGFKPTIKNIFAVILANADVYIRLMKDVHQKSFNNGSERQKNIGNLSKETLYDKSIYPWPEIKKPSEKDKQNVIAYPGDNDLIEKLKSDDAELWPEVDFVENYIRVATNKSDPNSEKETGIDNINFKLPDDKNANNFQPLNAFSIVSENIPYIDKSPSSFLYEIWERATYINLVDSFDYSTLKELSDVEFINIKNSIVEDTEIINILSKDITSVNILTQKLSEYSPFERYPFYQDELSTIPYIKDSINVPYKIVENSSINKNIITQKYDNLKKQLSTYKAESYRKNIYPFNSDLYLSYLKQNSYTDDELKFTNQFVVDITDSLIQTSDSVNYVKSKYTINMFDNKLKINNTNVNLLNTSFFHRQIYYDFIKQSSIGKYVASSYLLLNSLPFIDLDEIVSIGGDTVSKVKYSALFREIGATHDIPYHLICKWGSIYHRYKKYIIDGVDILGNILNPNKKTRPIDGELFFNNKETSSEFTAFTINGETVTYNQQRDIGIHPFYDAIFHQVVNDYNHYDVLSGNTSFSQNVIDKKILSRVSNEANLLKFWTSFVDNNKYKSNENFYTLLPCDGNNSNNNIIENLTTGELTTNSETFSTALQKNFRIIWQDEFINDNFDNQNFPSYNQYHRTYVSNSTSLDNLYSINDDYRKILDLIGTFSPQILDEFEEIFLQFSSEKLNDKKDYRFPNVRYTKFQDLLKEIVTIDKTTITNTQIDALILDLKKLQVEKLKEVTTKITSDNNKLKITIGNPKEFDLHVLYGFTKLNPINTFSYNLFNTSQLTTNNLKLIELYLSEDTNNYYRDFFQVLDVELNETNIIQFRPLIYIYAGYRKNNGINNLTSFRQYLIDNILQKSDVNNVGSFESRRLVYLNFLIANFRNLEQKIPKETFKKIVPGYNIKDPKIELYNYFKSFNDKWIAGNSIGQRLLLEEFLFLDKANKDIGDKLYINIDRLLNLGDPKNSKITLYGIISVLLQNSGLDMRPIPAYVNFYGNNTKNLNKITPSKNVASNLFGTFLEVDYQDSSPKIIIQYIGQTSKHLDVQNKKYKFADDSFVMSDTNNNPLLITSLESFENVDLSKSNRVVAFEVSFGDQNQSIFKSIQLDQSSLKNTSESFVVMENIARTESGAGAYNIDVGLFDYYRQASYTCDVTCFGNVMIQPTMFFYLKNVPMFKGSYWITEVTHNIKANNFTTTFKGTRIPFKSLPDPQDSFTSSYRVLFDKIRNKAILKIKNEQQIFDNGYTFTYNNITYTTKPVFLLDNEDFYKNVVKKAGFTDIYSVPYNGSIGGEFIQLINYTHPTKSNKEWLRARVVIMGGEKNIIDDNTSMEIVTKKNGTKLLWSAVKNKSDSSTFYSLNFVEQFLNQDNNFNQLLNDKTFFVNPKNSKELSVEYKFDNNTISGPITFGPNVQNFGIGMSKYLMNKLGLFEGDIVYFIMEK